MKSCMVTIAQKVFGFRSFSNNESIDFLERYDTNHISTEQLKQTCVKNFFLKPSPMTPCIEYQQGEKVPKKLPNFFALIAPSNCFRKGFLNFFFLVESSLWFGRSQEKRHSKNSSRPLAPKVLAGQPRAAAKCPLQWLGAPALRLGQIDRCQVRLETRKTSKMFK